MVFMFLDAAAAHDAAPDWNFNQTYESTNAAGNLDPVLIKKYWFY